MKAAQRWIVLVLLALAAMTCGILPGQVSTASVTGLVTDSAGGVVADAVVVLKNAATGVQRRTVSNQTGNYTFVDVQPGQYSLSVSKPGFAAAEAPSFSLGVNQRATIDVSLRVGQLQQTVTVEATGAQVEASSAGLGGVVREKQVTDLPLNGRNFTQLLTLSPGVSPISVGQNSGGGEAAVTIGSQFVMPSINGQTNRSTLYLTDGLYNTGAFFGTYGVAPIIDSLEEFKVNSHSDDVQFGGALGGAVNVVTKSGTNELHGSAWEFVRNDAFDARNTFQSRVTPFKQNQFGFSLGGPVILPKVYNGKNKTFFYGALQELRYRQPVNNLLLVPTPAELAGDLSDVQTPLFNPFTTRPNPNGSGFIRDPFPANQIPASMLNPTMIAYAKAVLPKAGDVGIAGRNAIDATPTKQNEQDYTFRVDQTLGDKNFFWFRYSGVSQDTSASAGLPSLRAITERPGRNYGASYVRTFSPSLIMQLQYGRLLSGQNYTTRFVGLPPDFAATLGFDPSFVTFVSGDTLLPNIGVASYFSGGDSISLEPNLNDVRQFKGNVAKTVGRHSLSFGAEFDTTNYESFYEYAFLNFANQQTGNPANSAQPGNALASFLIGVPNYAAQRNVHETFRFGGNFDVYAQDSWKITQRLTLNLGLRYDRTFLNPYGKQSTVGQPGGIETGDLDLNTATYYIQKLPPSCEQRGRAPCIPGGILPSGVVVAKDERLLRDTKTNLGPRVGIAYRLTPNTAIRAGFGIFYDNWAGAAQRAQSFGGNWPDVALRIVNNLNTPTLANPVPTVGVTNPLGPPLPQATPWGRTQRYVDPNIKNPYSEQWNFAIQHQFSESTAVSLAYVGSESHRLSVADYTNVARTPGPGDPALRRPYPYIASTYFETSSGNSNYNAFQAQYDRRFSRGLGAQVSYTWSKSIDTACSGFFGVEGCSVQDPYHTNMDRSVSGFDITHMLAVNIMYQLPVGKGKALQTGNRVVDALLGSWQINTITTARSGQPYFVSTSSDIPNTGNLGVRANLVGDPRLPNPSRSAWFNAKAFAPPPLYTFGNLGRNSLRTDPFWNVDASVFRIFPFLETRSVEFRAEAFNVLNNVVYGAPDANLASPTFSRVFSTANSPRVLQLGLKVIF
ncbi:MAG TPA: carboxypeptidase regulatory-like domain-containing protein [Bryobacteraceae bacterium]|nr:carboxypeptidase regulatory-like domain-containing protein [Bryobacteraceae bacterium]